MKPIIGSAKLKLGAFVRIDWIDSRGARSEWTRLDTMDTSICKCSSVGWIMAETKEAIVIAPTVADDRE